MGNFKRNKYYGKYFELEAYFSFWVGIVFGGLSVFFSTFLVFCVVVYVVFRNGVLYVLWLVEFFTIAVESVGYTVF